MSVKVIAAKLATMETRITTEANINIFDRALIMSDLTGLGKEFCLDTLIDIRGDYTPEVDEDKDFDVMEEAHADHQLEAYLRGNE